MVQLRYDLFLIHTLLTFTYCIYKKAKEHHTHGTTQNVYNYKIVLFCFCTLLFNIHSLCVALSWYKIWSYPNAIKWKPKTYNILCKPPLWNTILIINQCHPRKMSFISYIFKFEAKILLLFAGWGYSFRLWSCPYLSPWLYS